MGPQTGGGSGSMRASSLQACHTTQSPADGIDGVTVLLTSYMSFKLSAAACHLNINTIQVSTDDISHTI